MKKEQILMNNLYTVREINRYEKNKITVLIDLNARHDIFKGHFPENPILPGVCCIQIIKEIMAYELQKEIILSQASSIKYISFINPNVHRSISFAIEYMEKEDGIISCSVSVYFESITFCKFKGEFLNVT